MDTAVFAFLNTGALLGWTLVLMLLISQPSFIHSLLPSIIQELTLPFFDTNVLSDGRMPIIILLLFLEVICFIEVGRIAIGQLKGNLVLGVILHIIRMSCLLIVLPAGLSSLAEDGDHTKLICTTILYSWSITEVGRYPMYLFPSSSMARHVRLILPIFTFPVGAFAEAVGAYKYLLQLLSSPSQTSYFLHWMKVGLLGLVVSINTLLGPTMAYPALLRKGLPVLMGKQKEGRSNRKKKD